MENVNVIRENLKIAEQDNKAKVEKLSDQIQNKKLQMEKLKAEIVAIEYKIKFLQSINYD